MSGTNSTRAHIEEKSVRYLRAELAALRKRIEAVLTEAADELERSGQLQAAAFVRRMTEGTP